MGRYAGASKIENNSERYCELKRGIFSYAKKGNKSLEK